MHSRVKSGQMHSLQLHYFDNQVKNTFFKVTQLNSYIAYWISHTDTHTHTHTQNAYIKSNKHNPTYLRPPHKYVCTF